jgi:uncharacterized protein YdeI (YjbR/CyaY-like superfamily)
LEILQEIYLSRRNDWRDWLAENNATCPGVWLVYYKKHTGIDTIAYADAVEEALCFGWIDTTVRRLDNQRYCQKFMPRRKKGGWSGHNRRRAEELIASGAMTAAGMAKIEDARANGAWDKALEDRVDRPVPPELADALANEPKAAVALDRLTPSQRKLFVNWVADAKREETRVRRSARVVENLLAGKKPGM